MKAIQIDNYQRGNVKVALREVEMPATGSGDVLVRVHAAGVNPIDVMIARGEVKIITPYRFPLTLGNEMAGVVERVGRDVADFRPGDRVFARLPTDRIGAFAEYVSVPAEALAPIPGNLSFSQAAAIPLAALTTCQALDLLRLNRGDTLFISGGSGSFGAIAIPLAAACGLKVITSGGQRNRERVLAIGASQYLDYETEDYTLLPTPVDGVIDTLGGSETAKQLSILKKGGVLVSLRGMPDGIFAKRFGLSKWKQWLFSLISMRQTLSAAKRGQTYQFLFVQAGGKQLRQAAELLGKQHFCPTTDGIFPLDKAQGALDRVASHHSQGKTIIEIGK